jgi:hypothetical protein
MSHIYQPVMLMTLLQEGGECSAEEIACAILEHDRSQIELQKLAEKQDLPVGTVAYGFVGRGLKRLK